VRTKAPASVTDGGWRVEEALVARQWMCEYKKKSMNTPSKCNLWARLEEVEGAELARLPASTTSLQAGQPSPGDPCSCRPR
jgi:hypothetical protein